jgi:hypothetical protein
VAALDLTYRNKLKNTGAVSTNVAYDASIRKLKEANETAGNEEE